jgi:hypothetical protein
MSKSLAERLFLFCQAVHNGIMHQFAGSFHAGLRGAIGLGARLGRETVLSFLTLSGHRSLLSLPKETEVLENLFEPFASHRMRPFHNVKGFLTGYL